MFHPKLTFASSCHSCVQHKCSIGHNTRGGLSTLCAVVFSLIPSLDCQVALILLGYRVLTTAGYSMLLLTSKSCTCEPTIPLLCKFIHQKPV